MIHSPNEFNSETSCLLNWTPFFGVTKQYEHSPFSECGRATTAASIIELCWVKQDSISAVLSKCPETLSLSSILPVIHR